MANIKLFVPLQQKQKDSFRMSEGLLWRNEEKQKWCFAVVDVIEALTGNEKPRDYWYRMNLPAASSGVSS